MDCLPHHRKSLTIIRRFHIIVVVALCVAPAWSGAQQQREQQQRPKPQSEVRIPVRKEIVAEEGGEADLPLMPPILSPIPQAPQIFFDQLAPQALPPVEAAHTHSRRLWPWLLGGAVGGVWIGSDRGTDPSVEVDTVPDIDPGVPITTTPEPSTWLLMSLGLVAVGVVSRLRGVGAGS